ncbi:MAG: hypothetical protein ACOX55_09220 [Christensenellales bacterium]
MSQWKYTKKRKKGEHLTYIDRQKLLLFSPQVQRKNFHKKL